MRSHFQLSSHPVQINKLSYWKSEQHKKFIFIVQPSSTVVFSVCAVIELHWVFIGILWIEQSVWLNLFRRPNQLIYQTTFSDIYYLRMPCVCCRENHQLYHCPVFVAVFNIDQRYQFVRNKNLCRNCLSSTHPTIQCSFTGWCKCSAKHHSLLCSSKQQLPKWITFELVHKKKYTLWISN